MPNYRLTLCYDGTRWKGWQKQGNTDHTIQGKLETLLSRPEFAWNLLVFTGDEETLRRADEKKEKLGLELAAYYKNHTAGEESGELVPVTLLGLWNWRTGSGEELSLPVLSWQEDNLIPEGVLIIKSPCSFPKRDLQ